ncbi:MAG: glycosyltransferase family 39 protein [Thermoplasmata archaeon]
MEIFALIIALFGVFITGKNIDEYKSKLLENKYIYFQFLLIALSLIFLFRAIPYINNDIPLGYDTGLYKFAIEHGIEKTNPWILYSVEPGFLYLMHFIDIFLPINFILIWLFILFNVLLGFSIYLVTKEYYGKTAGLIAVFIYSLSIVQFKVFELMYYKNIIALSMMMFAFYFLKKESKYSKYYFITMGVLIGVIHRPTFYIFGLSYLIYSFSSPYTNTKNNRKKYDFNLLKSNVISGIIILVISLIPYLGDFRPAIFNMIDPVISSISSPGESPGTFISFFSYQFTTLAYLPFAIIGLFYSLRHKDFNIMLIMTIILGAIVYFQLFFFNRFIIFLDIGLIILASIGVICMINERKKTGTFIVIILFVAMAYSMLIYSTNSKPLIDKDELSAIEKLNDIPKNSYVLTTSSYYGPWVQGYGASRVITPGFLDIDFHNKEQWNNFWRSKNKEEIKSFVDSYPKPLYIFIGKRQSDNIAILDECVTLLHEINDNKIYKYLC